jgi:hypothetical protein
MAPVLFSSHKFSQLPFCHCLIDSWIVTRHCNWHDLRTELYNIYEYRSLRNTHRVTMVDEDHLLSDRQEVIKKTWWIFVIPCILLNVLSSKVLIMKIPHLFHFCHTNLFDLNTLTIVTVGRFLDQTYYYCLQVWIRNINIYIYKQKKY